MPLPLGGMLVAQGRKGRDDRSRRLSLGGAEIAVDNDDTLTRRDLSLVVRYDRRLAVDTLVVHIATHTPDSLSLVERLTLHIPPTEAVHPVERIFPYRSRAVLLHRGIYNFTVTPQTDAAGIESVGLIIEESATDSDR